MVARDIGRKRYSTRETDITDHVIVGFERHAAPAKAHPQVADQVEDVALRRQADGWVNTRVKWNGCAPLFARGR